MQFSSVADARARLSNTINYLGNTLYFIQDVTSEWNAICYTLDKLPTLKAVDRVHVSVGAEGFRAVAPKISFGWMNTSTGPRYAERRPTMGQGTSMGIVPQNVFMHSLSVNNDDFSGRLDGFLTDPSLKDMIDNKYPTVASVVEEGTDKAFSKHFALKQATLNAFSLFHKRDICGEFDKKENKFALYPSFKYLKELLESTLREKGERYGFTAT